MRTDSQPRQDVMAELKWEPALHPAQIGDEVKDGAVTLAGILNGADKMNHVH